jgi:hypothetical protein
MSVDRVRWFRLRAARDRRVEEVGVLKAEFCRTERSFSGLSGAWQACIKDDVVSRELRGANAYASKQALMYYEMGLRAKTLFQSALDTEQPNKKSMSIYNTVT